MNRALRVFPFSVDALNAWASIYLDSYDPPQLFEAEATYELALKAARMLWPDLQYKKLIEWKYVDFRPFLRAHHGLGLVQKEMGKFDDAIKNFQFLLGVNPTDSQGTRELLFDNLIHIGDYKQAGEVAEKHAGGRKSKEAYIHYGFVLIDFLNVKVGTCSEANLQKTLARAVLCNSHVPSLVASWGFTFAHSTKNYIPRWPG